MLEMLFTQGRLAFCKAIYFPATEPTAGLCTDDNPNLNYPYKSHEDVLFALMEAWQCLLSEGFVAPRPTNLRNTTGMSQNTTYFVTRRGKKIETLEDYEDYCKADLLRKHQLHPIIAEKVWFIFRKALMAPLFLKVEIAVREAGDYAENAHGADLMRKAFNVDTGNLTDQSRLPAVKQAMSDFLAGAIGLYKNPTSHYEVEFAPEEAAEIIILASHLLRIVDSCVRGFLTHQINLLNFHFILTKCIKKLDNCYKRKGAVAAAPRLPKPIEML